MSKHNKNQRSLRKYNYNEFCKQCPATITCMLVVPNTKNENKCVTLLFLDPQESKSESRPTNSIKVFHTNPARLGCYMYEKKYSITHKPWT